MAKGARREGDALEGGLLAGRQSQAVESWTKRDGISHHIMYQDCGHHCGAGVLWELQYRVMRHEDMPVEVRVSPRMKGISRLGAGSTPEFPTGYPPSLNERHSQVAVLQHKQGTRLAILALFIDRNPRPVRQTAYRINPVPSRPSHDRTTKPIRSTNTTSRLTANPSATQKITSP